MSDDKAREFKTVVKVEYEKSPKGMSTWVLKPEYDPDLYGKHLIEYSAVEKLEAQVKELENSLSDWVNTWFGPVFDWADR